MRCPVGGLVLLLWPHAVAAFHVPIAAVGPLQGAGGPQSVSKAASPFAARACAQIKGRSRALVASEQVIVDEDYKLGASLVAIGLVVLINPALFAAPLLLLGSFLLLQTLRIRFVFDEEAFEVKTKPFDALFDSGLGSTGENFAVGGENRWKYSSFVNYDFLPSESLPILVYFKEVQTPEDKWDVGPGKWANSEEALAQGAVKGQVHFFPCIAKADVLKKQFVEKGCAKL